jgi:hypothetical protein
MGPGRFPADDWQFASCRTKAELALTQCHLQILLPIQFSIEVPASCDLFMLWGRTQLLFRRFP